MADKTQKSETNDSSQDSSNSPPGQQPPPPSNQGKKKVLRDPILEFIAQKEKESKKPISDRFVALLRREYLKNKESKLEEIWRRIYG